MIDIWLTVTAMFQFAIDYSAAMRACGEIYGDNNSCNAFVAVSQEAIWRQLLSEISKIFDRASTCGFENCSLSRLLQACLDNQSISNNDKDEIQREFTDLFDCYKTLFSRDLRNKKLAHYDLDTVLAQELSVIMFDDIEELVIKTATVLSYIGNKLLGVEVKLYNYDEKVYQYQKSMRELTQEGDTPRPT